MMQYPLSTALPPSVRVSLLNPYSNRVRHPLLAALPPPVLVYYWRPIQIWCTVLYWLPCLILSCILLIDSLLEYDTISSLSCLAFPLCIQILCDILSSLLASSCARFLLKTYLNMMHYPLLVALPHPLMYSFFAPSLSKYDPISYHRCLASSCARFLLKSSSNMMQYPVLAAMPHPLLVRFSLKSYSNMMQYPLLTALPPSVLRQYIILIQVWCDILSSLPCLILCSCII